METAYSSALETDTAVQQVKHCQDKSLLLYPLAPLIICEMNPEYDVELHPWDCKTWQSVMAAYYYILHKASMIYFE